MWQRGERLIEPRREREKQNEKNQWVFGRKKLIYEIAKSYRKVPTTQTYSIQSEERKLLTNQTDISILRIFRYSSM